MTDVERLAVELYDKYSQAVGGWEHAPGIVRDRWLKDAREILNSLDLGRGFDAEEK